MASVSEHITKKIDELRALDDAPQDLIEVLQDAEQSAAFRASVAVARYAPRDIVALVLAQMIWIGIFIGRERQGIDELERMCGVKE
jgi:hypothetical protein